MEFDVERSAAGGESRGGPGKLLLTFVERLLTRSSGEVDPEDPLRLSVLEHELRRELQIRGLEISMNDADRVRGRNALARLKNVAHGVGNRRGPSCFQHRAQIGAVEVLHHQIWHAGLEGRHITDARHVLAANAGCRSGLAHEARAGLRSAGGKQELQRDALLQVNVGRGHDDAHATPAEDLLDAVLPADDLTHLDEVGHSALIASRPRRGRQGPGTSALAGRPTRAGNALGA